MVQGAISLSWVIYNFYLPKLLVQFGFPQSLAVSLLVAENALAVLMEPLMGSLSDNNQRRFASRFPFITVGVLLSSALFIAIPCVVTFVPPTTTLKLILPVVVVAWALAMTVFRSPVLSLLGRYAMPKSLPMAASVLTLIGGTIGSFRIAANDLLLSLGPVVTFATGSFVLLGSAAILRFIHPPEMVSEEPQHRVAPSQPISIPALGLIFVVGGSFAWGYRLLFDGVGKFLKLQPDNQNIQLQMVIFGMAIAVAALPAGAIAKKIGNRNAMLFGIIAAIIFMLLLLVAGANIIILAPLAIAISFVLNGSIPFALEMVPSQRGGLGVGTYFGGVGLAMSIFGSVFTQPQAITPQFAIFTGAIAFVITCGCIIGSRFVDVLPSVTFR
jgi:MFS family permease